MYMDNIKLFARNEKESNRIYSQDIGMEFGIEKCAMLVMKSGKQHLTDGMEQSNQNKTRTLGEKGNLQILGDTGSWHHEIRGDERKNYEKIFLKNQKATQDKTI